MGARGYARLDSVQLLAVIFVWCRSNAHSAGFWLPSGPSNTVPLSAVDYAIFNDVQS